MNVDGCDAMERPEVRVVGDDEGEPCLPPQDPRCEEQIRKMWLAKCRVAPSADALLRRTNFLLLHPSFREKSNGLKMNDEGPDLVNIIVKNLAE